MLNDDTTKRLRKRTNFLAHFACYSYQLLNIDAFNTEIPNVDPNDCINVERLNRD
jgi:hypothetical protein